jgi:hypothetical protein
MWNNTVQPERPQVTTWRMRVACCIPKTTNTHPKYVVRIVFPPQQWFHERASVLRYTYSTMPALFYMLARSRDSSVSIVPSLMQCAIVGDVK